MLKKKFGKIIKFFLFVLDNSVVWKYKIQDNFSKNNNDHNILTLEISNISKNWSGIIDSC